MNITQFYVSMSTGKYDYNELIPESENHLY